MGAFTRTCTTEALRNSGSEARTQGEKEPVIESTRGNREKNNVCRLKRMMNMEKIQMKILTEFNPQIIALEHEISWSA